MGAVPVGSGSEIGLTQTSAEPDFQAMGLKHVMGVNHIKCLC